MPQQISIATDKEKIDKNKKKRKQRKIKNQIGWHLMKAICFSASNDILLSFVWIVLK